MSVNLQKKISVSKCFGKVTAARIAKADGVLKLGQIMGQASGTKTGVTDFGEWTALTGRFRAINTETGEVSDSGVCFMPDVALDLVLGELNAGAKAVEFAFELSAVADESVAVGFTYRAAPLLQLEESDPVALIQKRINEQKALAAPKDEAAPEAETKKKK